MILQANPFTTGAHTSATQHSSRTPLLSEYRRITMPSFFINYFGPAQIEKPVFLPISGQNRQKTGKNWLK
jgi:hypothetical protein